MCLITKNIKPKIAEADIKVFKFVYEKNYGGKVIGLKSNLLSFNYIFGKTYKETLNPMRTTEYDTMYDHKVQRTIGLISNLPLDEYITISKGFHSISMNDTERLNGDYNKKYHGYAYVFIIPKGSTYYVDDTGLLVSNQIIPTNKKIN